MSGRNASGKASSPKLVTFGGKAASTPLASSRRLGRGSPFKKATPVRFGGLKALPPSSSTASSMGTSSSKATEKKRQRTSRDGDKQAGEGEGEGEGVPSKDLREVFVKGVASSELSSAKKQRADEGQDEVSEMKISVFGDFQMSNIRTGNTGRILRVCLGSKETKLSPTNLKKFCAAMASNKVTTSLNFNECGIGNEGCKDIALMISSNKALRRLSLQSCNISDQGVVTIADAIRASGSSLVSLNLTNNPITTLSAHIIEEAKSGMSISHDTLIDAGPANTSSATRSPVLRSSSSSAQSPSKLSAPAAAAAASPSTTTPRVSRELSRLQFEGAASKTRFLDDNIATATSPPPANQPKTLKGGSSSPAVASPATGASPSAAAASTSSSRGSRRMTMADAKAAKDRADASGDAPAPSKGDAPVGRGASRRRIRLEEEEKEKEKEEEKEEKKEKEEEKEAESGGSEAANVAGAQEKKDAASSTKSESASTKHDQAEDMEEEEEEGAAREKAQSKKAAAAAAGLEEGGGDDEDVEKGEGGNEDKAVREASGKDDAGDARVEKKRKVMTLGLSESFDESRPQQTYQRVSMEESRDGGATFVTRQEIDQMLNAQSHGEIGGMRQVIGVLIRKGRVASPRFIGDMCDMMLGCKEPMAVIEVHGCITALSTAAHRAGVLEVDEDRMYHHVNQACTALCTDLDQGEALAQSLFLSLVCHMCEYTSSTPEDANGPSGFMASLIRSQDNRAKAAENLMAKLVSALDKNSSSSSHHIQTLISLVCSSSWSESLLAALDKHYSMLPLRTKILLLSSIASPRYASLLADRALMHNAAGGKAMKGKAIRDEPPSWQKFDQCYSQILDMPCKEGESVEERCMMLSTMARCLCATEGSSGGSKCDSVGKALAEAHRRLVEEEKKEERCAVRGAVLSQIEVILPDISASAYKVVAKAVAARGKARENEANLKRKASVRSGMGKGKGARGGKGGKVKADGGKGGKGKKDVGKKSGKEEEEEEDEEDEEGGGVASSSSGGAGRSGKAKVRYTKSEQLPYGGDLVGVKGLEVKSLKDGGWWQPVHIETYNAKKDTYDCLWDNMIFRLPKGPGDRKDPMMWERNVPRERIRLESKFLPASRVAKTLVAGNKVCVMCPQTDMYREATVVKLKGKQKVIVNIEGFKNAQGVWEPRPAKETFNVNDIMEIR